MSVLYPRLPLAVAKPLFLALHADSPLEQQSVHPEQVYAPVGGGRATEASIDRLIHLMTGVAKKFGYPLAASDSNRIAFDREAAFVLHDELDFTWAEAGSRDVWNFLSLVVLPSVTAWRFGLGNQERWVASDLTRHTWARLWWQAVVFQDDPELLQQLSESDLNQLIERRSIGGDPRLVRALGQAVVVATPGGGGDRRPLIRDVTARLRRRLGFVDTRALSDDQVSQMCTSAVQESQQFRDV
ncbi:MULTISPECIES: DUF6339 family protein [Cryobacterium]|uniref:DUF6339 family protein n=1 Tax=Cryobacterium TaxID=69578 RepID=UPI00105719EA|nr:MULTISPECIES: DUF6339 family protein [Cryobacterium]TFC42964.1 hypothetical protein E3O57_14660 [Cryobacterium sp. TMN-39-2]